VGKTSFSIGRRQLELIGDDAYVNFGGPGGDLQDIPDTKIRGAGRALFLSGIQNQEPDQYVAFFAHPYDLNPQTTP
jgi:hypothetical protein